MTDQNDGSPSEIQELRSLVEQSRAADLEEIQARLARIEQLIGTPKKKGPLFGNKRVSNASVVKASLISAAFLSVAVFYLIRGYQWHSALTDLRSEPGIEIMSVRSITPFKTQIIGLRDPRALNPTEILRKHNISSKRVDLRLTEFHSLNTPFERERSQKQSEELETLRETIISVVGNLSEENSLQREAELGRISEILLELRFPEAMEQLKLQYADGVWHAAGDLPENRYNEFRKLAPKYILNGVVDLDNIDNYTAAKTKSLGKGIESCNLLTKDYNGEIANAPRISRLIRELDIVYRTSDLAPTPFQLIVRAKDPTKLEADIAKAIEVLKTKANLTDARINLAPVQKLPSSSKESDSITLKIK